MIFRTKAGDVNFARVEGGGQGMVEFADRNGLQFALDNKDELTLNGQRLQIRHTIQSPLQQNMIL